MDMRRAADRRWLPYAVAVAAAGVLLVVWRVPVAVTALPVVAVLLAYSGRFTVPVGAGLALAAVPVAWGASTVDGRDAALSWVLAVLGAGVLPWSLARAWTERTATLRAEERALVAEAQRERLAGEASRAAERRRMAEEIHDGLGHELSLVVVQANVLELDGSLTSQQRRAVAELRERTTAAVQRLGRTVDLLRDESAPAPTSPARRDTAWLVDDARAAGMDVTWDGPPGVAAVVVDVVREGLSNAARHAPGSPVRIMTRAAGETTVVDVVTELAGRAEPAEPRRAGTGLRTLAESLTAAGGSLRVTVDAEEHRLYAVVPARAGVSADEPSTTVPAAEIDGLRRLRDLRRSSNRRLLAAGAIPIIAIGVVGVCIVLADWRAASQAYLDPARAAEIRVGAPLGEVEHLLPRRELDLDADDRAEARRGVPEADACRYYAAAADPLADASGDLVRICARDGRVTSVDLVSDGGGVERMGS